ncbi:MAG: hypothetical protein NXH97_16825 [Rhodobacteraceae bacterium]|nr:hypothetical protein [Paracoccaceae bacterium]
MSRLLSLVAALLLAAPAPAAADDGSGFPQVVGTWTGTYLVAFAKSNPNHDKGLLRTEMELEVTKLDGNLITATNRWRRIGDTDWVVEEAMGTFQLDDPTRRSATASKIPTIPSHPAVTEIRPRSPSRSTARPA